MHCEKNLKVGDLVRFKISAINQNTTEWLRKCAKSKTPMLIVEEYINEQIPIESYLLNERVFRVMVEDVFIAAAESELTKRGL